MLARERVRMLASGVALLALLLWVGAPGASQAPPLGVACQTAASPVLARIGYDSGAALDYCDLRTLFIQLAGQEQGDVVRSVLVRTEDGRWLPAEQASFARGPRWRAYARDLHAPEGLVLNTYHQQLRICAETDCAI